MSSTRPAAPGALEQKGSTMKLKTLLAVAAISIATLPTNVALAQVKKDLELTTG
jgi:hypothetical protein